jgi:hypothetical protein
MDEVQPAILDPQLVALLLGQSLMQEIQFAAVVNLPGGAVDGEQAQ